MYLSKQHLCKKENINLVLAEHVWRTHYFLGWGYKITWFTCLLAIALILFTRLDNWLAPIAIIIVHLTIAQPLASKRMKKTLHFSP